MKIVKFDLKWVHMARYELILKMDEALWLRIIFQPLLTPKGIWTVQKSQKNFREPPPLDDPNLMAHCHVNSEGCLAEVFHPWVHWEEPGSGFESSSGGGAGRRLEIWES